MEAEDEAATRRASPPFYTRPQPSAAPREAATMFRTLLPFALAGLLCLPAGADETPKPKTDDLATDPDKPASPTRPVPKWVELVDLGKQDKRLAGYRAPAGIKVEIVAEAPAVVHPVGLSFLEDGTPLVIEWTHDPDDKVTLDHLKFKYKDGSIHTIQAASKNKKDVIKALTRARNNTVWEKPKVILEEQFPSTVLPFDGWLYVASRGTVRRHKQSKEGGSYDKMETVARGFGGVGGHQVSGLTIGPDGWLYVTCGEGDNDAEGSDGSRATILRTGGIFRCKPDGARLHVFARGLRNPHRDVAFDANGHLFHLDSDGSGEKRFVGCRLLHVPEGSDFGWRTGYSEGKADPVRAAAFGELPGKMPPMLKTGKGGPAGLLIYNDTQLPEEYRGLLLYPDAARRLVRAYRTEAAGSTFKVVEEFELLSAPKDEFFRPVQMVTGPDGAIYVVDLRIKEKADGKAGRIYRLSWAGTKDEPAIDLRGTDSWSKVAKLEDDKLIEALGSVEASERERARRDLVKRGDKNRAALLKYFRSDETRPAAKVVAVGALQWMYDADVEKAFVKALDKGDDEVKRVVAEALGLWAKKGDTTVQDALLKASSEEDLAVRRAVFVAMGRVAGPGAADGLATALSFDEGKDRFLRDAVIRSLEMLGKEGMTSLLALGDSGVQKDTDRVVEAVLGMRTREAFAILPTLLRHEHVTASQRAQLIRSVTNYQLEPPVSLDPIAAFVAGQKKETSDVKMALLNVLATPGVSGGKKCDEWSRSMLTDANEDAAAAAVAAVAVTADGAVHAGKLLAQKKLARALRPAVVAALKRHAKKSAEAAKVLEEVEKE
jgi:quinoprotein glucose dehydrogenase